MSNVLERLGVPVDCIVYIDFETTYSRTYQLRRLTTESYIRDPQFQVIGVGVAVADGDPVWMEEAEFREFASYVNWSRVAIVAHHAHFDGAILEWHFGIRPGFWLCTLSMARAVHGVEVGGSLAKLATYYGVGEKGNEVLAALGKRREDFTDSDWTQYGVYCCGDVSLARGIFWKLAEGFQETEFWLVDTTVRMFTEPNVEVDVTLLRDSLETEKKKKADLLARVAPDRETLMSNDRLAAFLTEMGVDVPMKVSLAKTKSARKKDPDAGEVWVPAFSKVDPGMKALLEDEREEVRWVIAARLGVKSTLVESRTERILGIAERGRMPFYLKYAGAHTLRWSGADRVNVQNFTRGGDIKDALLAPEGHVFVACDSNAIEARKLSWISGHELLRLGFARDEDVYSQFAGKVYRRKVDRKIKLPDGTKPDAVAGAVGKQSILGLGYQMGTGRAATAFLAGPMGAPPVQFTMADAEAMRVNVEAFAKSAYLMRELRKIPTRLQLHDMVIHCAVTRHIVDYWREDNQPIVEFWATCEQAIQAMISGEEFRFGPNGCLYTSKNTIHLPSGGALRYPDLQGDSEDGYTYRGRHGKGHAARANIYGGLLTENLCQRLSRDVIGEQMLEVRADGHHIIGCTHDEILAIAPEAQGEAVYARMIEIMKTAPSWAPGLPLNAEGGFARSYGAAK